MGKKPEAVWEEPRLPAEKISELALGIFTGEVFTSKQIRGQDANLLPMIFLPLGFFSDEQHKEFVAHPPALLCGWMKDALPRSINGYPFLPEMRMVYAQDAALIREKYEKLRAAAGEILKPEAEEGSDGV
jgi:hypothetical protein